jgi:hypothetical protein
MINPFFVRDGCEGDGVGDEGGDEDADDDE